MGFETFSVARDPSLLMQQKLILREAFRPVNRLVEKGIRRVLLRSHQSTNKIYSDCYNDSIFLSLSDQTLQSEIGGMTCHQCRSLIASMTASSTASERWHDDSKCKKWL